MENENIEAIEEEKQGYLEEHPEEDVEVEEIEFNLKEVEINEWISELSRLKDEKQSILLNVDPETDLKINFEKSEENSDGNFDDKR
jgi:hypothetical protein